jgi:hypothetical protein
MSRTTLLRPYVESELAAARTARRDRDRERTWRHLERAHILSQPSARLHSHVHVVMIVVAVAVLDVRELFGQVVRLSVAGIGSLFGRYPVGNTGRARVPINLPMPIPADLQAILDSVEARLKSHQPAADGRA